MFPNLSARVLNGTSTVAHPILFFSLRHMAPSPNRLQVLLTHPSLPTKACLPACIPSSSPSSNQPSLVGKESPVDVARLATIADHESLSTHALGSAELVDGIAGKVRDVPAAHIDSKRTAALDTENARVGDHKTAIVSTVERPVEPGGDKAAMVLGIVVADGGAVGDERRGVRCLPDVGRGATVVGVLGAVIPRETLGKSAGVERLAVGVHVDGALEGRVDEDSDVVAVAAGEGVLDVGLGFNDVSVAVRAHGCLHGRRRERCGGGKGAEGEEGGGEEHFEMRFLVGLGCDSGRDC